MDTLGLRLGVVQRSAGQDARGLAAYQLCGKITTPRRKFDFRCKAAEREAGTVLLPRGAPAWASDPAQLWTAAEDAERRGDAQIARTGLVSIPRDVPAADRMTFAAHLVAPWVEQGMTVQVDVHAPPASDGLTQPHAHLLITLRRFEDGRLAATKARDWNQAFRDLPTIRKEMAARANQWMAERGISTRLDHRSRADRGEDLPPEPTVPRAAWAAWRRDQACDAAAPIRALLDARRAARDAATAEREATKAAARLRGRYSGAREACWTAYQAERQAARTAAQEQRRRAEQAARDELRTRQCEERTHLRRTLRRGTLARAVGEAVQDRRHERQRHAARVQAYRARWATTMTFPAFEEWTAARAAAGDEAAQHVARAAERRQRRGRADHQEAAERFATGEARAAAAALRATEPRGPTDARQPYGREAERLARRRDAAARAAQDAEQQARAARGRVGIMGVLFGGAALREAAAARQVADAAARRAAYAAMDHDAGLRAASEAAEAVARENRAQHAAWERAPETAALRQRREAAEAAAAAVSAGDPAAVAAAAESDLAGAAEAARAWRERTRQQQEQEARHEAERRARDVLDAVRAAAPAPRRTPNRPAPRLR